MRHVLIGAALLVGCGVAGPEIDGSVDAGVECASIGGHELHVASGAYVLHGAEPDGCGSDTGTEPFDPGPTFQPGYLGLLIDDVGLVTIEDCGGSPGCAPPAELLEERATHVCTANIAAASCFADAVLDCVPATDPPSVYPAERWQGAIRVELRGLELRGPATTTEYFDGEIAIAGDLCTLTIESAEIVMFDLP